MNKKEISIINVLHNIGLFRQDFISILYNLRPCVRISIPHYKVGIAKILLSNFGLRIRSVYYKPVKRNIFYIGKNDSLLREACALSLKFKHFRIGALLGYPSCCIEKYVNITKEKSAAPVLTLSNTKEKSSLDHRLNYLFNFDSRITSLKTLQLLNRNKYLFWSMYLIPHVPCSFECETSKKYASKLKRLLMKSFPEYLSQMLCFLKKQVLFINDYEFLLLELRNFSKYYVYKNIFEANSLIKKNIVIKLNQGNKLRLRKNNFSIYNNKKFLYKIDYQATLFNFK